MQAGLLHLRPWPEPSLVHPELASSHTTSGQETPHQLTSPFLYHLPSHKAHSLLPEPSRSPQLCLLPVHGGQLPIRVRVHLQRLQQPSFFFRETSEGEVHRITAEEERGQSCYTQEPAFSPGKLTIPNVAASTGFLLHTRLASNSTQGRRPTQNPAGHPQATYWLDPPHHPPAQTKQLTWGLAACTASPWTSHFWSPQSLLTQSLTPPSAWASSCAASSCARSLQRWRPPAHERPEQHPPGWALWEGGTCRGGRGCCPETEMGRTHQLQHPPFRPGSSWLSSVQHTPTLRAQWCGFTVWLKRKSFVHTTYVEKKKQGYLAIG